MGVEEDVTLLAFRRLDGKVVVPSCCRLLLQPLPLLLLQPGELHSHIRNYHTDVSQASYSSQI